MNLLQIENETICPIVLYGTNRGAKVTEYHKKVMVDYFNLPINYVECPFPQVSHGWCMNQIIAQTIDSNLDYYWFIDHDSIILKKEFIDIMYGMIKNKRTLFSQATQSNHKPGPNGEMTHPYASQAFLSFSKDLFNKLDRPDCDHWIPRSDTAEEMTYKAKEKGYIISLMYPSSSVIKNSNLDNGFSFGMGNLYGPDLCAHAMQQNNPDSEKWFINICEKVLAGEFK